MSAHRLDGDILDALFDTEAGWLEKPIEPMDLATTVRHATGRRRAAVLEAADTVIQQSLAPRARAS